MYSVLEIVTKLCDPDFNRRAKTSDFYARTWDVFVKARREGPDKVCLLTLLSSSVYTPADYWKIPRVPSIPEYPDSTIRRYLMPPSLSLLSFPPAIPKHFPNLLINLTLFRLSSTSYTHSLLLPT